MASVDTSHLELLAPVGTSFLDKDGDLCVYLGPGGYREFETVGSVEVNNTAHSIIEMTILPACHVMAFRYKGEWHLREMKVEDLSLLRG